MPDEPATLPKQPTIGASQRDRLFWIVLGTLVAGLLAAFWMVCSHQVRKAQMRDLSLQVQRVAVADCLQYVPRATLNSCVSRVDPYRRDPATLLGDKPAPAAAAAGMSRAAAAGMSSAAPVSVAYH